MIDFEGSEERADKDKELQTRNGERWKKLSKISSFNYVNGWSQNGIFLPIADRIVFDILDDSNVNYKPIGLKQSG